MKRRVKAAAREGVDAVQTADQASPWTDDRVEMLKRLWADGLSASQIAVELGAVNRNAVIGKVHRLGLSGRRKPRARQDDYSAAEKIRRKVEADQRRAQTMRRNRASARADGPDIPEEFCKPVIEDDFVPADGGKTLLDLTNATCRWPIGDPATHEFCFCGADGADLAGGHPYCPHHTAKARGVNPRMIIAEEHERRRTSARRAYFTRKRTDEHAT